MVSNGQIPLVSSCQTTETLLLDAYEMLKVTKVNRLPCGWQPPFAPLPSAFPCVPSDPSPPPPPPTPHTRKPRVLASFAPSGPTPHPSTPFSLRCKLKNSTEPGFRVVVFSVVVVVVVSYVVKGPARIWDRSAAIFVGPSLEVLSANNETSGEGATTFINTAATTTTTNTITTTTTFTMIIIMIIMIIIVVVVIIIIIATITTIAILIITITTTCTTITITIITITAATYRSNWLNFDWLIDRLIIGWMSNCLIDLLIDGRLDWLIDRTSAILFFSHGVPIPWCRAKLVERPLFQCGKYRPKSTYNIYPYPQLTVGAASKPYRSTLICGGGEETA